MAYEDSKKIVNSVLDIIKDTLKTCDVLALPDFGKFENRKRDPYVMTDNFPGSEGKKRVVPAKYTVKFIPSPKLNASSAEHYQMQEAEGGED